MASSSSETSSSAKGSPSQLKPRKVMFRKKKMMVAKRRVQSRRLEYKKTSPAKFHDKKSIREEIDNFRMSQRSDKKVTQISSANSAHGAARLPTMRRIEEVMSKLPPEKVTQISSANSAHGGARLPTPRRAEEVMSKLPPELPSFLKTMLPSHVSGGFWLGLPKSFCDRHLPDHDATVLLVEEGDKTEYATNFLVEKNGLSGGWRGFSIKHNLVAGDVLIFQLIETEPFKFKVYIVRANVLTEIDGTVSLLDLESHGKAANTDGVDDRRIDALDTEHVAVLQPSGNKGDELGSKVNERIRFSESFEFKDVKSFDSFNILVDGIVIDTEIPIHLRFRYYELCCKQKSFLHDRLLKGLNCKLAAGIISETVSIADAIRGAKLNVSLEDLQSWDKTLKAFEDMGMNVGFMRSRLSKLVCLSYEQQKVLRSKRQEQAQAEAEMKDLETRLLKVKEIKEALDAEIEVLMRST